MTLPRYGWGAAGENSQRHQEGSRLTWGEGGASRPREEPEVKRPRGRAAKMAELYSDQSLGEGSPASRLERLRIGGSIWFDILISIVLAKCPGFLWDLTPGKPNCQSLCPGAAGTVPHRSETCAVRRNTRMVSLSHPRRRCPVQCEPFIWTEHFRLGQVSSVSSAVPSLSECTILVKKDT